MYTIPKMEKDIKIEQTNGAGKHELLIIHIRELYTEIAQLQIKLGDVESRVKHHKKLNELQRDINKCLNADLLDAIHKIEPT